MAKNEQPPIFLLRVNEHLVGELEYDRNMVKAIPAGVRVKVVFHTGRSPKKLRFWWAFLNEVVKATDCAPTAEALNDVVKLNTGFVTPVRIKGYTVMIPRSISYGSMSEADFDAYVNNGLRFIAENYGITPEQTGVAA